MTRDILYAALTAVMLTFRIAAEEPDPPTFTQVDYPGAAVTGAFGVNAHKDIVGFYVDMKGTHGFLLSGGNFSTIDYPGASVTQARGINNRGDIVGTYQVNPALPGGDFHGFLLRQGVFTKVDYPGHLNTFAQRITDSRQILGCYHDQDFMATMHGMVESHGRYRALDGTYKGLNVPASMNNGATPEANVIAGFYTDMMNNTHGYLIRNGNFAPFDFPGSLSTQAWDMNASDQVVGVYSNSTGVHGFLLTPGDNDPADELVQPSTDMDESARSDINFSAHDFVSVDYPTAKSTRAFGINSQGDVVGQYADSTGNVHAFLLSHERRQD